MSSMLKSKHDKKGHKGLQAIHTDHICTFVLRSYRNLSPRTRMIFGFGLMGYASFGLWSESRVEKTLGMVPSEAEKEELDKHISVKIHSVDKAN
ncbi:hypothetical protein LOZ58_004929 [Ophidiomyces ophidiicola]|nr:hypothetical protein LOZ65_002770 [Ophidiomyces ophidiicola]KAI1936022.1 hypothetical protein LOZ66_004940 [Ophidiomyces ophidiicola]KAI1958892.1 hypothetical protein LOZ58_004929 [Ophidiomyces ophidiicola]